MSLRDIINGTVLPCTPSDTTQLAGVSGFYCNTAGNISFFDGSNNTAVLNAIAGVLYPIKVHRILATGTTAAGIYLLRSKF